MAIKIEEEIRGNIRRTVHVEPDGDIIFAGHQDLEPTLAYAKAVRESRPKKTAPMVPVAEIPGVIWDDLRRYKAAANMTEKEFNLYLRKWANDPQNRCFRLTEGHL